MGALTGLLASLLLKLKILGRAKRIVRFTGSALIDCQNVLDAAALRRRNCAHGLVIVPTSAQKSDPSAKFVL